MERKAQLNSKESDCFVFHIKIFRARVICLSYMLSIIVITIIKVTVNIDLYIDTPQED